MLKFISCALTATLAAAYNQKVKFMAFEEEYGLPDFDKLEADFMVISLKNPNDEQSVLVDSYMQGAEEHFNLKIKSGDWSERTNLDWHHSIEIEKGEPGVFIVGTKDDGMRESRKFTPAETKEESEELLADMVHQLTGDWVGEIKCDEIEEIHDSVIFFGKKDFLETDEA